MNSIKCFREELARAVIERQDEIQSWFSSKTKKAPTPFYSSIDLRDSGHKVVPVDSNLYPAGFNNICPADLEAAPSIFKNRIESISPEIRRVLIIPESNTKNKFYIENLVYLRDLIQNAGFETDIGWYSTDGDAPESVRLESHSGIELTARLLRVEHLSQKENRPDLVVLNNDFSGGYPELLDQLSQPVVPSHKLGWHTRKKSQHFEYYNALASEFAEIAGIDPWRIQLDTREISPVDFADGTGLDQIEVAAKDLFLATEAAYREREINEKPFVFIKSNSGTYGMGIHVLHDPSEVSSFNRRTKNKLSVGKNRSQIRSVVLQEGVPTAFEHQSFPAEPVIYLVGCELIGGFLRANSEKSSDENLNSKGMVFEKLCMSDLRRLSQRENTPTLELAYGTVARLAALAAGMELANTANAAR